MPGIVNIFEQVDERVLMEIFNMAKAETPRAASAVANTVAEQVKNFWQQTARAASPWGGRYASAIEMEPMGTHGGSAKVYLNEDAPGAMFGHMMEEGVRAWSIKEALLASARAKKSKSGVRYITVPMRFRTPGETKATSSFAGVMPQSVYEKAKSGALITAKDAQEAGSANLAGLKKYNDGVHSAYLTFRTVTDRSPGWAYPQKAPTPVFPKAVEYAKSLLANTIADYVKDFADKLEKKYA